MPYSHYSLSQAEEPIEKNDDAKKVKLTEPRPKPAQDKLSKEISDMKSQYYAMQQLENSPLSLVSQVEMNSLKIKIVDKEQELKRKVNKAEWSKGSRSRLKETITKLRFLLNIWQNMIFMCTNRLIS